MLGEDHKGLTSPLPYCEVLPRLLQGQYLTHYFVRGIKQRYTP
jgi:hypothetical protein